MIRFSYCAAFSGSLTNSSSAPPMSIIGMRPRMPRFVCPVIMMMIEMAIGPRMEENFEKTEKKPKNSLLSSLSGISRAK